MYIIKTNQIHRFFTLLTSSDKMHSVKKMKQNCQPHENLLKSNFDGKTLETFHMHQNKLNKKQNTF